MVGELWTVERIEQLRGLVEKGASAGDIAVQLACGLSRNAIIGKVHRLGLSFKNSTGRQNGPDAPRAVRKVSRPSAPQSLRRAVFDVRPEAGAEPAVPIEPIDLPHCEGAASGDGVTFVGLQPHHCRWPSGDPCSLDFRYCGDHRIEGKPYCAHHDRKSIDLNRRV